MSEEDKTLAPMPEEPDEEGWQEVPNTPPSEEATDLSPSEFAAQALGSASEASESEPAMEEYDMAADFDAPVEPLEEPKKNNTLMIVLIVILVLLCCCCLVFGGAGWWLYNNGDEIFGLTNLATAWLV